MKKQSEIIKWIIKIVKIVVIAVIAGYAWSLIASGVSEFRPVSGVIIYYLVTGMIDMWEERGEDKDV